MDQLYCQFQFTFCWLKSKILLGRNHHKLKKNKQTIIEVNQSKKIIESLLSEMKLISFFFLLLLSTSLVLTLANETQENSVLGSDGINSVNNEE